VWQTLLGSLHNNFQVVNGMSATIIFHKSKLTPSKSDDKSSAGNQTFKRHKKSKVKISYKEMCVMRKYNCTQLEAKEIIQDRDKKLGALGRLIRKNRKRNKNKNPDNFNVYNGEAIKKIVSGGAGPGTGKKR
jgi:hypothetical protein